MIPLFLCAGHSNFTLAIVSLLHGSPWDDIILPRVHSLPLSKQNVSAFSLKVYKVMYLYINKTALQLVLRHLRLPTSNVSELSHYVFNKFASLVDQIFLLYHNHLKIVSATSLMLNVGHIQWFAFDAQDLSRHLQTDWPMKTPQPICTTHVQYCP